ncbi:protein-L-isoaspartate(D-aspartate) O-methyltransferase [Murinocardiopsis flavida]|uniref:Protein-L-isoaspartate O-methyltransferase n=1 Tax=Murinocardiopsis flavida TaxID=645275 RepID=A0A2P8DTM1_9ACTN|nr:methyltransferase domain-containing protein [Murinocardiopsis flavida]PSL00558.1 protein-L-isoaspartate(D-aspartate) O-methyltransferase [Murinocardiopsis flavida]
MTTPTESGPAALVGLLRADGLSIDPQWEAAFVAVPRHAFLPDVVWENDADGWLSPVGREDSRWRSWAYSDVPIVTQVDDGEPEGADGRGRLATSSASQPLMVLTMLEALEVYGGARVLEIGTATGFNAALLSERLGAEHVTTIEIDAALAEQGRANLHRVGFSPSTVVGDGTKGVAAGAPYDRVLATVAAKTVPYAWVEQTRPGGLIVAPWGNDYLGHRLLRLVVGADGTASGWVIGPAAFMWLRDQRSYRGTWRDHIDFDAPMTEATTTTDPRIAVAAEDSGVRFVVGFAVADLYAMSFTAKDGSGESTVWLYDARGSWAAVDFVPGAREYAMSHHGPRNLWAEVEHAVGAWEAAGRPDRERFGVTVTPTEQQVWLDEPDNVVA